MCARARACVCIKYVCVCVRLYFQISYFCLFCFYCSYSFRSRFFFFPSPSSCGKANVDNSIATLIALTNITVAATANITVANCFNSQFSFLVVAVSLEAKCQRSSNSNIHRLVLQTANSPVPSSILAQQLLLSASVSAISFFC